MIAVSSPTEGIETLNDGLTAACRVLAGSIALAVLSVAAAACDSSSDRPGPAPDTDRPATTAEPPADVTVLVSGPTGASMDALGGGKIKVIGGCLGVGGHVVIWPPGTQVASQRPLKISIPRRGDYSVGDTVRLGGGNVRDRSDQSGETLTIGSVEVPATCLDRGVFLAGPQSP